MRRLLATGLPMGLLAALLWLAATPAVANTLEVGPQAAPGIRAIAGIDAGEIGPGTIVRLHAGHYRAPIVIPLSGTAAAPIEIAGAGDGPMQLDGPVVLDGAAFVVLHDLVIDRAADAGIVLRRGSHDIVVRDCDISNARLGVWIGDPVAGGAGDHNRIEGNRITASATHGIAVDGVNAREGHETVIAGNTVADNGIHGIELSGNHYIVEGNTVSGNGRRMSGASGIHVYAASAREGVGQHNVIRGNISFDNRDAAAQDGNGIQIDQWCDDNLVEGNIVTANDGAGISVFDAARARIVGNTAYGDMRDPGHSHRHKGELSFASDDSHDVDGTKGVVVERNIVVAVNPEAAAMLVDGPTARHPPRFAGNLLWHAANGQGGRGGGDIGRWQGRGVRDLAAWNALPRAAPDLLGDPHFADPHTPTRAGFVAGAAPGLAAGLGAMP